MRDWKSQMGVEAGALRPRTLVELYGCERVLIEEHRGILAYGEEEIRVGTSFGALVILGFKLRICCMSRTQLVIRGKIAGVRTEVGS